MNYPAAFFVSLPLRLDDLKRLHTVNRRKPYVIEKTIQLAEIDYENFASDLRVYRRYIEENAEPCRIDDDGVWHCILVRQRGKPEGILVMPDKQGLLEWAAYLPDVKTEPEQ